MGTIIIRTEKTVTPISVLDSELAQIKEAGGKWITFMDISGAGWLVNTEKVISIRMIEDDEKEERSL